MKLSAEQIQENYEVFRKNIIDHIASPRKEQLLEYYQSIEDILLLAPASSKEGYHNAFPGGYVDHVNRVVEASLYCWETWNHFREVDSFTKEELVFSAINHDLGKLGEGNTPGYIPNESEWHVKNQGAIYKNNTKLSFMLIPDRSIFNLVRAGMNISENEFLAIKLHDGLYEDANKPYLISFSPESRLRTSLPLILHQADMIASRVEWENHWIPKLNNPSDSNASQKKNTYKSYINQKNPSAEAYMQLAGKNNSLMDAFKNI
jgi:hypothetical protein